ncbi:Solute carrier family 45 member 3 [Orchesella cincta]|uniref:Solute carrier family 45 member 3 n=1 Tax=Orchesella cincta TaxID=48709 RepID=A0A1D2M6K3_ORCCI|nr:Solute carrier family 45 member 3 [Orchesella cincta]
MAGLGGSIGYFLGALNWENTFLGRLFGGHVRAVFTLVLFIFIACVIVTIRSFREIPIDRLWANKAGDGSGMPNSGQSEHKPKSNFLNLCNGLVQQIFCWMSLVCYSLYFTDFVGEAVFGGRPNSTPRGQPTKEKYDEGAEYWVDWAHVASLWLLILCIESTRCGA